MAKHVPPEPPYRWHPLGTSGERQPDVGALIAWRHMAWRVIESAQVPEVDWTDDDRESLEHYVPEYRSKHAPWVIVVRPVAVTSDDPRSRDHDVHLSVPAGISGGFEVYRSDHYPVCSACNEPLPCREEMARELMEKAARKADAHSLPGVCPACDEPVTARQRAITFEENLRVPLGPPVTFHLKRDCRGLARRYEQEWAAASPDRMTTLSCPGHWHRHLDGSDCSEGPLCAGKVPHRSTDRCYQRRDGTFGTYGMEGSCSRCQDAAARRDDEVRQRQAAGDWTIW